MDPVLAKILWASFLGVAVGAAAGVLIAAAGKRREADARNAYLSSFRYILKGDPDAAIEALALSDPASSSPIATGVALGALFRKKGDWSRAIRIHETLLQAPSLSPWWKRTVALELGLDFRGAGMVSQAVEVLESLVEQDPGNNEALLLLRQMSEDSGDWERALGYHEAWERSSGPSPSVRAHLLAALARAHLEKEEIDRAEAVLEDAKASAPSCLDVRLAVAEFAAARGDAEEALATCSAILGERSALVFRVLSLVEEVHPGGAEEFLDDRLRRQPRDPFLRLALARRHRRQGKSLQAIAELQRLLEEQPDWMEARQDLGRILLEDGSAEELRAHLGSLLLETGRVRRPFSCRRCDVEVAAFLFRCPRCFSWDTIEEHGHGDGAAISAPIMVSRPSRTAR